MKTITSMLLVSLICSPAMALPKKLPQAYKVHCIIMDDRDGGVKISDRSFTFHRGQNSPGAAFREHFKIKSSDHDLTFLLGGTDRDDHRIWIGLADETAEYGATTFEENPKQMNVSLRGVFYNVSASCSFTPKKVKKQNINEEF